MMEEKIKDILTCRGKNCIRNERLKRAAVLIPLFKKNGEYHILFTRRTEKVEHHKGQISFPGGRQDEQDGDLLTTALREAQEEMGINREDVRLLGELDDICTTSDYCVAPYVGLIPYPYPFQVNRAEIEEVIEVPVSVLLDERRVREEIHAIDGQVMPVYAYRDQGPTIWGATARILKQLLDLLPEEDKQKIKSPKE